MKFSGHERPPRNTSEASDTAETVLERNEVPAETAEPLQEEYKSEPVHFPRVNHDIVTRLERAAHSSSKEFLAKAKRLFEAADNLNTVNDYVNGKRNDMLAYQDEWSRRTAKAIQDGMPMNNPSILPFAQARGEVMELTERYADTFDEEERQQIKLQIEAKESELRGPLTANLEDALQNWQKEKAEPLEATPVERRQRNKKELSNVVSIFSEEIEKPESEADTTSLPSNVASITSIEKDKSSKTKSEKLIAAEQMVASQKAAMESAEAAYLEKYKEFHIGKKAWESKEPEELKALKRTFDKSRIVYGRMLTMNAQKRLEERGMKPGVADKENHTTKLEVLERYNRLIRYNEIIRPAAENRYNARLQAMSEREKGTVMKSLMWLGEQNKKLENKFGKTGSRIIRITATAGVAGTIGVATGTIAAAGLVGWGAFRLGRSLANSFIATGIGAATGKIANPIFERVQKKAQENLKTSGRTGDGLSMESLEEFDADRQNLLKNADNSTLRQRKILARVAGAFVGGAGLSMLENLPSLSHGAAELSHAEHTPVPAASHTEHVTATHVETTPRVQLNPTHIADAPTNHPDIAVGETIHKAGEGTDQLFGDLKHRIYGSAWWQSWKGNQSHALQHLLQTKSNELSREMGSVYGSEGMTVHDGDQFFADDKQNIWFEAKGGKPQLFIENDGSPKGYSIHELKAPEHNAVAHAHSAETTQPHHHTEPGIPRPNVTPETDLSVQPQHNSVPVTVEHQPPVPMHDALPVEPSTTVSHPEDIIVTANKINPGVAHVYESTSKHGLIRVYGGTPQEQKDLINKFFSQPANYQKQLYAEEIDPTTKEVHVSRYWGNYGNGYLSEPNLQSKHGGIFGLFAKTHPSKLPPITGSQRIIA